MRKEKDPKLEPGTFSMRLFFEVVIKIYGKSLRHLKCP